MRSTSRMVALLSAAALVGAVSGCKGDRGPAGPPGPSGASSVAGQGQNLAASLDAARITSDGHLQVDYTLTDASGNAATMSDVTTYFTAAYLGTDAESNLPAWQSIVLAPASGNQPATPTYESNSAGNLHGTTDDLGGGRFRYTFATAAPQSASLGATWRIGSFMRRPLPGIANPGEAQDYDVANAVLDFVPGGGTAQPRDLVATQSCNACHGILQAHGGYRRDTRLCVTCHTTQLVNAASIDTGTGSAPNPLDFGRMIHRIHRGSDLPTVAAAAKANDTSWSYQVVSRFGTSTYAAVTPNPNPAAAATTPAVAAGVSFPQDIRNCAVCHSQAKDGQGNVVGGAQADQWMSAVSRRTCQSCHDSSWWKDTSPPKYHVIHQQATNPPVPAGTNPATPAGSTPGGLVQADDSQCKTCHSETLMQQHHTAPNLSSAFNALSLKIDSTGVQNGTLTVNFTIANADGSPVTDLRTLGSASASVSGPTDDYQVPATFVTSANLITAATAAGAAGTYQVAIQLPPEANAGTWAVGLEARRVNAALTASERKLGHLSPGATAYDFAPVNPVAYFDPTGGGGATRPRRQVVSQQNCNACHQILSAHGSLRHTPEYCVMCHAPNATDKPGAGGTAGTAGTGRPPGSPGGTPAVGSTIDRLAARSIHFKAMIHQIHTGDALEVTRPLVVYGFGQSPAFLDEARFPGTRARCEMCHAPQNGSATYTIDAIPDGALPTLALQWSPATADASGAVTTGGDRTNAQPITAACVTCHDPADAHAHIQQQQIDFQTFPGDQWPTPTSSTATESCGVCHGESADFAVTRVHAKFNR